LVIELNLIFKAYLHRSLEKSSRYPLIAFFAEDSSPIERAIQQKKAIRFYQG